MEDVVIQDGVVINIGPWVDPDGNPAPLPEGAYIEQRKVVTDAEGGRRVATEYDTLRELEYPSIGDQLDALFHAGLFPPEMAAQLRAVKDKYPKEV